MYLSQKGRLSVCTHTLGCNMHSLVMQNTLTQESYLNVSLSLEQHTPELFTQ